MVIGLVGQSCVGKTAIGEALSAALEIHIRSCGEQVRSEARSLGVPMDALSDDVHRNVDAETRDWVVGPQGVVEGRFLDYVLAPLAVPPLLVRLTASDEVRCERWRLRAGQSFGLEDLRKGDNEDAALIGRLYSSNRRLVPSSTIDTSSIGILDCVNQLRAMIKT